MKYKIKNWLLVSSAILLILAVILLPKGHKESLAQNPFIFGGFVISSIPCTCNGFFLLTISPPVGGQFLFPITGLQYANYQLPRAGVWTLGLYTPGGVCLVYAGKGCAPVGLPLGIITPIVGSSF